MSAAGRRRRHAEIVDLQTYAKFGSNLRHHAPEAGHKPTEWERGKVTCFRNTIDQRRGEPNLVRAFEAKGDTRQRCLCKNCLNAHLGAISANTARMAISWADIYRT